MEFNNFSPKNKDLVNNIKITLEDFPDDIYILLEDEFRAKFFKTAWKINKSYRHLAKKIGVSAPTMLAWRRNKDGGHYERFVSIKNLRKILDFCKNSDSPLFDFRVIEKHIKYIRAIHGKLRICNPKLPIDDSVELREIVTHLLCDGYASNKKRMTSKYDLTSLEAVKEFQEELSLFGKIQNLEIRKYNPPKPRATVYRLNFPKAITKMLCNEFNVDFSWNKGRIPKEFFRGDKKLLVAIVRAFLIDEGHIHSLSVKFSSNNLELLYDLESICLKLNYESLGIRNCKSCYVLSLSTKSFLNICNDIMSISPLPILKKQKRLELGLKLLKKRYIHSDVGKEIIELLKVKPMTISQLCEKIISRRNNIDNHLNKLKTKNVVTTCLSKARESGGGFIWKLAYQK
ncbi:MAG: hypothetical protein V1831_00965 [Candidatus Woesearchaeota archaeon]